MKNPPNTYTRQLGIRPNWLQFSLLIAVNGCVGGMVGLERAVVPLLGEREFGLSGRHATLSFIVAFGICKAIANSLAGKLNDRFGRRPVLLLGWLIALPVPVLLAFAQSWNEVIGANALLGLSQGLAWSTTVVMKIDIAGPQQRGLAMGLNEFAGYTAVAASATATGWMAEKTGFRLALLYLGLGIAGIGLLLSFFAKETRGFSALESALNATSAEKGKSGQSFWKNPNLFAATQAGFFNNLNDGMAWGLFPLLFASQGWGLQAIGLFSAIVPATWGIGQLATGPLSDRLGRKVLIVYGMWVQAFGIVLIALVAGLLPAISGNFFIGLGTAMVYPTLLAAIADNTSPSWRASAVGIYRFWRDLGYAIGALVSGAVADRFGINTA
ncbi:MAG: MFS transporter, partial [Deltaproteobacteria bacterium]|nr:MFS transporter [Deltaproteobacteria bacterium]